MKWLINLLLVTLIGYLVAVTYLFPPHPFKTKGELKVPGLRDEVEIIRDENGIPTIRAKNAHDLFMAQGFVHCQERFFQMDILRRTIQGRLSELFGEKALKLDENARRFRLNRFIWAPTPEEKAILEAYARGVNACLKLTGTGFEYKLLMKKREPWTPRDSVAVGRILQWGLASNFSEELVRYIILSNRRDLARYWKDLDPLSSPHAPFAVGEGEPIIKPGEGLEEFVSIIKKGMSNNWVISGNLTDTGRALLANDPHLEIMLPGIWYFVHLKGGGFDVKGVSLPGTPGVVIGKNDRIAWGFTNSFADVQDLYIVKINGNKYILNGKEGKFKKRKEIIKIRGGKEKRITFLDTELGPLVYTGKEKGLVLRWVGDDIGRLIESLIVLNKARNWEEFRKAMEMLTVPSQNGVYIDVDGNIGYQVSGRVPKRTWSGLFPVERGDWVGFYTIDELPHAFNPEKGYIVTANNRIKPDFPGITDVCPGYRAQRIEEMLKNGGKISIDYVKKMQQDVKSLYAERFLKAVLPILRKRIPDDPWIKALEKWDFRVTPDSPEAALFEIMVIEIQKKIFFPDNPALQRVYMGKLPGDVGGFSLFSLKSREALVNLIENKKNDVVQAISGGNYSSIEDAIVDGFKAAREKTGGKPWGDFHYLELIHPLGRVGILRFLFGHKIYPGRFPMGGDKETVVQASFDVFKPARVTVAPSMREIIDFQNEFWITVPGQSGVPSRHFSDMVEKWLRGQYIKFGEGKKTTLRLHP